MKKLLFLRHGKSSWEGSIEDRHRPLKEKGIAAVKAVAHHWRKEFLSYQAIVSSPANRALHTASILAHELHFPWAQFSVHENLYTFSSTDLLKQIHQWDDRYSHLIMVGHNPAFTYAADYLSVKPVPELKTADWISLTFAQNQWAKVAEGQPMYGSKKEALQ